jgi:membrane protein
VDIALWLRKRLASLGLILSLGFLLLVSLVITTVLSALSSSMKSGLPTAMWHVCDVVIPFAVYMAAFMALFLYLPDADLRWRHVWFGGFVTALLFVVGKRVIGYYLGTSALGSSYGVAGSLILMLVWTYYSAAIVLFGAELTHAYILERGEAVRKGYLGPKSPE